MRALRTTESNELQKELDKIDAEMQRLLDQIARLRAACGEGADASTRRVDAAFDGDTRRDASLWSGHEPESGDSSLGEAQHFAPDLVKVAKQGSPGAAREDQALESAAQALRQLKTLQRDFRNLDKGFGARILGPLSPWIGGVRSEAQPRALLFYIVKDAGPDLKKFRSSVTAMTPLAGEAKATLESIPPDTGQ